MLVINYWWLQVDSKWHIRHRQRHELLRLFVPAEALLLQAISAIGTIGINNYFLSNGIYICRGDTASQSSGSFVPFICTICAKGGTLVVARGLPGSKGFAGMCQVVQVWLKCVPNTCQVIWL